MKGFFQRYRRTLVRILDEFLQLSLPFDLLLAFGRAFAYRNVKARAEFPTKNPIPGPDYFRQPLHTK